jgi:hypothetical protein
MSYTAAVRRQQPAPTVPDRVVDRWLADCCEVADPQGHARSAELRQSWVAWSRRNSVPPRDAVYLGRQLAARGFNRRGQDWVGLSLVRREGR